MIATDNLSDSAEKAYATAAAEKAELPKRSPEPEIVAQTIEAAVPATEPAAIEVPVAPAETPVTAAPPAADRITAAALLLPSARQPAETPEDTAMTDKIEQATENAATNVELKTEKVADKVQQAARKAEEKAQKAAATVEQKTEQVAATVEEKADELAAEIVTTETKVKKSAEEFSAKVQDAVKEAQARAKAAYDKNKDRLSDVGEFTKGNFDALREAGKILASGIKVIGKTAVEETKANFGSMRADVQELRGVKSAGEFVKLQGSLVRKYFASAKAANSKQTEAVRKLASEAIQPISNRVSLAKDKVKKAA